MSWDFFTQNNYGHLVVLQSSTFHKHPDHSSIHDFYRK